MAVTFVSHADDVLDALDNQSRAALEAIGLQATSHAKSTITAESRVDTGALRNSISHIVDSSGKSVMIGTNVRYAVYNEMGTGIYIAGGRKSPWSYKDAKGNWHRTRGLKPIHFLKNAVEKHREEYKRIIERFLKGG